MTTPTSPNPTDLPPIPNSPTYSYASTSAGPLSTLNLPLPPPPLPHHAVLTQSDLAASQTAYTTLLTTAKTYRTALAALSSSASTFGSALEACARLKEARSPCLSTPGSLSNSFTQDSGSCTADSLMAASGVHQLIANHQQILSETVYRSFEVPLLTQLDGWRRHMEEEEESYQKEAKAMSKEIRKMEKEGIRLHGKRKRDVGVFREHLVKLTGRLDGLTTLHGMHARGLLREGQEMSFGIADCAAGLVRAEVDIFEALARKGWSGGGLDELLERGRDLFANEGESGHGGNGNGNSEIFSILPQKSILVDASHDASGRPPGHARSDSLLVEGTTYQSLAGAVRDPDVNSIFSERDTSATAGILNRSRGARPFSPPPMERVPVLERDPLELDRPEPEASPELEPTEEEFGPESPNTMVAYTTPNERGSDESKADTDGNTKDRERRWSVTNDGVVSE